MTIASVIMPAYNSELFIEKSIRSVVVDQGVDDLELIVVDDGSSDATWDLVTRLQKDFPQIKLLSNERGKGPSGARNTGLLHSEGRYISFLDSDDIWLPGHLKKSIERCEEFNVDVVFNDFHVVEFETGEELFNWFSNKEHMHKLKVKPLADALFLVDDDLVEGLLYESFIHLQSMVGKRESFEGILFNESLSRAEDTDFCIQLFKNGASFAYSTDVTNVYYRHGNSITTSGSDNYLAIVECETRLFSEYYKDKRFYHNRETLKKRLLELFPDHAFWMRRKGRYMDAFRSTLKAAGCGFNQRVMIEFCKIAAAYCLSLVGKKR